LEWHFQEYGWRGELINSGLVDPLVSSLAISPADPAVVYAGTRSGVFKTVNRGRQWTVASTGLPKGIGESLIEMLAIDPTNPRIVYAGTFNKVFKTINGAESWTPSVSHPMVTQTSRFTSLAPLRVRRGRDRNEERRFGKD
jgi:hypothetical protein